MFGTSFLFSNNEIPIAELALMYLKNHSENFNTPEEFIAEYVKAYSKMEQAINLEREKNSERNIHSE